DHGDRGEVSEPPWLPLGRPRRFHAGAVTGSLPETNPREGTMKADAAFGDTVINDISSAVLAIGRPAFPQVLISALRRVADVGHCMVFSFAGERSAKTLLDAGNIPTGRDLGVAYSEHFHQCDPNRHAILGRHAGAAPILVPTF